MNRHPETTDVRVLFVLEVPLETMSPDDAAQQVAAIGRKLAHFRTTKLPACRSLRIALDEPAGEQTATRVLRYLDGVQDRP